MGPSFPDPCAPQGANVQVAQARALAWCMVGFKNTYHMCEANPSVPYNVRITEFFKTYPGACKPFKVGILIVPPMLPDLNVSVIGLFNHHVQFADVDSSGCQAEKRTIPAATEAALSAIEAHGIEP